MELILIFILSIITDAFGDAFNDSNKKTLGHLLSALSIGILLMSPFMVEVSWQSIGWYFASYILLRISFFDIIYNMTRDLPIGYIGNTSLWDKFLQKFKPFPSLLLITRVLTAIVGIAIIIKEI